MPYDVQSLANNGLLIDCGKFAVEFSDRNTGNVIDYGLFDDGLSVEANGEEESRVFTIY